VPLLFHLDVVGATLTACPTTPLLIVEGEKDVVTAGELGILATTNADGAGKWRVEDTQTIVDLGARKVIICPDNDGPGIEHGIGVAKMFEQAGVEVRWLELPGLGAKEDLSDWVPRQVHPDAHLVELIDAAPLFDADALDWRSRLKAARPNAGCTYRGDIPNMSLALEHESRLKGCFIWNDFRYRVEVIRKTPWCLPEWWDPTNLTPVGHRALRDADIVKLGNYLTKTYDFGACATKASREAVHAVAETLIFDELTDWIDARPDWDGIARLNSWLTIYAGADTRMHATKYLALVGRKYIMQVLNRALNPGAKADYSLVFTCPQGIGKDRVFEAMFAPYYREGVPSPRLSQADFALAIAGAIVAHGAEMSAWRKSDVEEQKAALTRCVDHGRRAYGHEVRSYPRRTCLAFSNNDFEFLQDATGNRRYWVVSIIRDRVDIEGLRRDRDQILAEALARLKADEQHWPTPEEEERIIDPERREYMPEAALELLATLERFITEKPLTTRPNRGDFPWKWERRPQPLSELYLDDVFGQCFGMYAAIKRQGLDRTSKKDISYCTTWLLEHSWRRVDKRLPDGQRIRVWRAPDSSSDPNSGRPNPDSLGMPEAEKASQDLPVDGSETVNVTSVVANLDSVAGRHEPKADPRRDPSRPINQSNRIPKQQLNQANFRQTQNILPWEILKCNFFTDSGIGNFYSENVLEKACLGLPAPKRLTPATLDRLEGAFPRSRFLALDVETTGLSATRDGLRTVQISDGATAAMVVFDQPVEARALVVLADFLQGRRVVVHNARFEASWLHEAEIDLVLDDTALLFSAVRGSRRPKGDKYDGGGGGRISLADLAAMVLGETLDKTEQASDWAAPELTQSQLTYALNDAVVTHRIWEALRAELHRKSQERDVDIAGGYEDMRFSAAMARVMERTGIGFDVSAHQAWAAHRQEVVTALEEHIAAQDPVLTGICIASGVQLDRLFRQRLSLYPDREQRPALLTWPKTEKKRRLSFGREDLASVILADRLAPAERKLVEALHARAEQASCLATFGEAFSRHVVDGRLYGQLHAGGTVTGRYASTDPNLQNIPTDSEFRGFFRASEGRALVDADYSQLELRVFAARSGDVKMIAAFEAGWDYHDLIVQRVGCTRRQAKAINFGVIFGMSAATLAVELGVDDVTAGEYLRTWDEQAPTGAMWRYSLPRLYAVERGVRTARRWIDYLDDDEAEISANTRPMNYPVQGGAADVMHRAMRLLFERYRDWPGNTMPVLTVHDEILVEVDIASAERVASLLADLMIKAFRDVFPNGPTRFLAIPGIGSTWAAAKADGETREKVLRGVVGLPNKQGD
jgi:DNA polymerase I-like protein with 3'-5' exonuclease and polymerase domains/predicted P-loop ATPase